jgi:hypothetical protein
VGGYAKAKNYVIEIVFGVLPLNLKFVNNGKVMVKLFLYG